MHGWILGYLIKNIWRNYMDFSNRKILVAGTGVSGMGAVGLLSSKSADIFLYDSRSEVLEVSIAESLNECHIEKEKITIITGELPESVMKTLDMAVLSPGIATDADFVIRLRKSGIEIIGEMELAYRCGQGRLAAITGTNGKTTTTTLLGEIVSRHYSSSYVVGNIGVPYSQIALETTSASVIVAEVSSFQLETISTFHPKVEAILNITPDHLDRHYTVAAYVEAKKRIMMNQTKEDYLILNYDDGRTRDIAKEAKAEVIFFSTQSELESGYYYKDNEIIYAHDSVKTHFCYIDELQILGLHNIENVMAALAMAVCLGIPPYTIYKAVKAFTGVEHRMEYVAVKRGVKYYNDSKGTNPDAAIKAVNAMRSPTFLIAGGFDKHADYGEWIRSFDNKVKCLVLIGDTAPTIAACAKVNGFAHTIIVRDLYEAISFCAKNAKEGEAVLLSPACASWGMFKNYEERGRLFKELVFDLED